VRNTNSPEKTAKDKKGKNKGQVDVRKEKAKNEKSREVIRRSSQTEQNTPKPYTIDGAPTTRVHKKKRGTI